MQVTLSKIIAFGAKTSLSTGKEVSVTFKHIRKGKKIISSKLVWRVGEVLKDPTKPHISVRL